MTDDYKELLGKYITGNITPGTYNNSPNFTSIISKSYWNTSGAIPRYPQLLSYSICTMLGLTQSGTTYFHIIAKDILTTSTTDNMVLYGSVYQYDYSALTDTYVEEFIAVLDNTYYPIAVFDSDDNSVISNKICKLAYAEDGNIYGIDNQGTSASPTYRFIMLNNIAVKNKQGNYEIKLRKTYYFPNTMNTFSPNDLIFKKSPAEAVYFMLGRTNNGARLITTTLKIEVGSANEWQQYSYALGSSISNFNGVDMLLTQSADSNIAYIVSTATSELLTCDSESGMSGAVIEINSVSPKSTVIVAPTKFYYTDYTADNCVIREYIAGTEKTITTFDYSTNHDTLGYLKYINGLLFWVRCYEENSTSYLAYGCYDGITTNEISKTGSIQEQYISVPFHIKNNYGLYALCICHTPVISVPPGAILPTSYAYDTIYIGTLLNYTGLYSGTEYEYYNALIPTTARVYGGRYMRSGTPQEKDILFARQLYNSTIINNITTSTLEVPNTFLNSVYLKKISLFGASSYDLTDYILDVDNYLTKNVYEALYINFMNSINVIDSDTNTQYTTTAININSNINNILNNYGDSTMENKKIANLQINWQDGTTSNSGVCCIQNDTTDYTITTTIYVKELIDTIDINSSDNSQTYITLDASNLEVGKYYTLTQGLKIE